MKGPRGLRVQRMPRGGCGPPTFAQRAVRTAGPAHAPGGLRPPHPVVSVDNVACVFIDGENLRHSLVDLFETDFRREDYLPRNADWAAFFRALTVKAGANSRLRTYWYVVEDIDFWPPKIKRLLRNREELLKGLMKDKRCREQFKLLSGKEAMLARAMEIGKELADRQQEMSNRFDGWKEFQDGISSRFEAVEFRRVGSIRYNLFSKRLYNEKAVDVGLAIDLLAFQDVYDTAVIVSGDQDYVPAVKAVKNKGKRVANVSFLKRNDQELPGGARRLNLVADKTIAIAYDEMSEFMGLDTARSSRQVEAS